METHSSILAWKIHGDEKVTGRKARGLQTEEISCKCQIYFYLSLKWQEETSVRFFLFCIQIWKDVSLKIMCCHDDPWLHLNLTFLKPWDNPCVFLMEMFVLSYDHELCIYPRLCLQAEKAMAPHSSTLAWKIPWMEEPGGLQSMGSLRVGHDWLKWLSSSID